VRLDGHVLKLYADDRHFRAAAEALAAVAGSQVPTPELAATLPELRAVAQSHLDGRMPDEPAGVARAAGELLRSLHALRTSAPRVTAESRLAQAAKHAAVVTELLPALAVRFEHLLERLQRGAPDEREAVLSHGDFEAGQLLVRDGSLALLDLDGLCVAAPALDHANYAAHVVDGPGTLGNAHSVIAELADGYGTTPAGVDWHLAAALVCRSSAPFRRFREGWPERVEALVEAAEEALPR
jgi:aminoglycoside phosphotransferase (APT) family kinase protein